MSINELKENLANNLTQSFASDTIEVSFESGHFIVSHQNFTLRITISSKELSYSFSLNEPINNLAVGFGEDYEIVAHPSKPEMEELYQAVWTDLSILLKNIVDDEIYIGHNNKVAYIAYRYQDEFVLREFRKAIFFGISLREKLVDKNTLKSLGLKKLSTLK